MLSVLAGFLEQRRSVVSYLVVADRRLPLAEVDRLGLRRCRRE